MNSSITVADCKLAVDVVVNLQLNVSGNVVFKRNSVSPRKDNKRGSSTRVGTAVILRDESDIKVLTHDFERTRIDSSGSTNYHSYQIGANGKLNNPEAKKLAEIMLAGVDNVMKTCLHCSKISEFHRGPKFQYCSMS